MKSLPCLLALSVSFVVSTLPLIADTGPCNQPGRVSSLVPQTRYVDLDVNQIRCTIASDGEYADFRKTSSAGFEWPRGSGKTAIFSGGFWLVGKHSATDSLRTAVANYSTEFQPGPLPEIFNTSTNDDAGPVSRSTDSLYRPYKITRGDTLSKDYLEWPGNLGAPYEDVNGNGIWDQGIDRPRFYGDQQVWSVINDANQARHDLIGLTHPMGLECRVLYWAYDRPGPLANTMFIKWQFINRSDARYDSVHFAIWDDVDLGSAIDDLPGSDTTLDLGYVYNANETDSKYGSPPPAIGFSFLQGPIVAGAAADVARFNEGWKSGYKNLGMTSFVPTACSTFPQMNCPISGSPDYAPAAYNFLRGMLRPPLGYLTRLDGSIIKFYFSGDPETNTGDLPQNFPLGPWSGQEAYIGTNTGPFTLAQGDTQEIVAAIVVSLGVDRLNSVTTLKQDVAAVRLLYGYGPTVGVQESDLSLRMNCELLQNYPNPFNATTNIRYQISDIGYLKLVVYDMLGREVAVLVNEKRPPGLYREAFDASGLASGVYFYRLVAGGAVATKKLVIIK
jgi:hypothetical protein